MTSRWRVLSTISYTTEGQLWQADMTIAWNGSGRMPFTPGQSEPSFRDGAFPAWWRINGQLTRRFGEFEMYVGVENATNFIQQRPILGFDQPFGESFDASLAWGPLDPRMVYAGVRVSVQ